MKTVKFIIFAIFFENHAMHSNAVEMNNKPSARTSESSHEPTSDEMKDSAQSRTQQQITNTSFDHTIVNIPQNQKLLHVDSDKWFELIFLATQHNFTPFNVGSNTTQKITSMKNDLKTSAEKQIPKNKEEDDIYFSEIVFKLLDQEINPTFKFLPCTYYIKEFESLFILAYFLNCNETKLRSLVNLIKGNDRFEKLFDEIHDSSKSGCLCSYLNSCNTLENHFPIKEFKNLLQLIYDSYNLPDDASKLKNKCLELNETLEKVAENSVFYLSRLYPMGKYLLYFPFLHKITPYLSAWSEFTKIENNKFNRTTHIL
mgnify:CR=1 FL=1